MYDKKFLNRGAAVQDQIPQDKDEYKYLEMLVIITLQFIRAEQPSEDSTNTSVLRGRPSQNKQKNDILQAETLTVNASACEFMELLLKQVQKSKVKSYKIAHMIIGPLISTFKHVIEKKNYAM